MRHTFCLGIKFPLRTGMLLMASLLLFFGSPISIFAQSENASLRLNILDIPFSDATRENSQKILAADSEHKEEIDALNKQMRELKSKLQTLELEREEKIKKLLTAEQLEAINILHLKDTRTQVKSTSAFLREFAKFSCQLTAAEKITIYEGLPRVNQDEIKRKSSTIQLNGFDFYEEPLNDRATTVEEFRRLLVDYRLYSPEGPEEKLCGGFHPDICLQFHADGEEYRALICLGCWEVRVIGPKQRFDFDFNEQAFECFKQLAKSIFVNHELQYH